MDLSLAFKDFSYKKFNGFYHQGFLGSSLYREVVDNLLVLGNKMSNSPLSPSHIVGVGLGSFAVPSQSVFSDLNNFQNFLDFSISVPWASNVWMFNVAQRLKLQPLVSNIIRCCLFGVSVIIIQDVAVECDFDLCSIFDVAASLRGLGVKMSASDNGEWAVVLTEPCTPLPPVLLTWKLLEAPVNMGYHVNLVGETMEGRVNFGPGGVVKLNGGRDCISANFEFSGPNLNGFLEHNHILGNTITSGCYQLVERIKQDFAHSTLEFDISIGLEINADPFGQCGEPSFLSSVLSVYKQAQGVALNLKRVMNEKDFFNLRSKSDPCSDFDFTYWINRSGKKFIDILEVCPDQCLSCDVLDLGAAPGGWSLQCLKRGCSVTAVTIDGGNEMRDFFD